MYVRQSSVESGTQSTVARVEGFRVLDLQFSVCRVSTYHSRDCSFDVFQRLVHPAPTLNIPKGSNL